MTSLCGRRPPVDDRQNFRAHPAKWRGGGSGAARVRACERDRNDASRRWLGEGAVVAPVVVVEFHWWLRGCSPGDVASRLRVGHPKNFVKVHAPQEMFLCGAIVPWCNRTMADLLVAHEALGETHFLQRSPSGPWSGPRRPEVRHREDQVAEGMSRPGQVVLLSCHTSLSTTAPAQEDRRLQERR